MSDITLSCILPAYNEAPRIGRVLEAVLPHPLIEEVIVIDDGSCDGTADLAEALCSAHPKLRVLRQPVNGGKSRAVARGIAAARGQFVLLLDSDLMGLGSEHLTALALPVLEARADASISLRHNAPWLWRLVGLDYISGERVMPRALLADHPEALTALPRFGLEVHINRLWLREDLRLAVVRWPEVESPFKHAKHGRLAGLRADISMLGDIFRTVSPLQTLGQIIGLRRRRICP